MAAQSRQVGISMLTLGYLWVWLVMFVATSQSTDLLSLCPPKLARTNYLKASDWKKCYKFHPEERTWNQANGICGSSGGHLVTIKEERVQRFLLNSLSELRWPRNGVWIGANDKQKEMDWVWITGEKVKDGYSRWASGQPSCGFFCFEDCALMRWKEGGRWHDYRCNWLEDYSFICEYDMLAQPTTTSQSTAEASTSSVTAPTAQRTSGLTTVLSSEVVFSWNSSVLHPLLSRVLDSDYLLHSQKSTLTEGVADSSSTIRPSALGLEKSGEARAEHVVNEHTSSSSSSASWNSGSLASVTIVGLIVLLIGLILFLVFRRRRSQKIKDSTIGYGNPYYEDDKDVVSAKKAGWGDIVASPDGQTDQSQAGSHRVMNDYNEPPALRVGQVSHSPLPARVVLVAGVKKEANFYDQVSQQPDNVYTYDFPQEQRYGNYGTDGSNEDPYYNFHNENIYESVDSLEPMLEQQRDSVAEFNYVLRVAEDEEGRYVPFVLDNPKES